jgi:hypothetical protein
MTVTQENTKNDIISKLNHIMEQINQEMNSACEDNAIYYDDAIYAIQSAVDLLETANC